MAILQFQEDGCRYSGAALTFTTLLAVVPLMTVTYSMLSAIPSFQGIGSQIQDFIFSNFVPQSGQVVNKYLQEFANQARQLTAIGISVLVITALLMLVTIEKSFNQIWQVNQSRKGVASFLIYWAILSLGPLLMGLGLVSTSYILSLPFLSEAEQTFGVKTFILSIAPWVFSLATFTLIYVIVPNCSVHLMHGFAGALVATVLFEVAKKIFGLFITHFPTYELIYGAFAAVPVFLVWIFLSWQIVLFGAELVRAMSALDHFTHDKSVSHPLVTILAIFELLWAKQLQGQHLHKGHILKELPELSSQSLSQALNLLYQKDLIVQTSELGLVMKPCLITFTFSDLLERLEIPLPSLALLQQFTCLKHVIKILMPVSQGYESMLKQQAGKPLAEFFKS